MNMDDLILVSVDDHIVEPPSMTDYIRDHVPARFKDRAPRVIRRPDGTDAWLIEGQEIRTFGLNAVAGRPKEDWGRDPDTFEEVRPGAYDVHERVRDMNANGILASLNFSSWPGLGGQFFVTNDDKEFSAAILRAYNDWHIDEWCGSHPGRFIPLALSGFAVGPEFMAEEIRRVAAKGCHAVSFHPEPHRFNGMPDIHGDEWDEAYRACEESDTAMVFHFGSAPNFMPRAPFDVLIHTMPFATGIFASELLWSPILRKFPTLRFSLAEAGIGWVPYWLERADITYQKHHTWTGQDFGDKLPSQVFRERVLTCFIEDTVGLETRHHIGVENIAWECDYPHSDATWPQSPEILMKSLVEVGLPDDEINKITWENACAFYRFDPFEHLPKEQATVGALRALATDVDTTPKALHGDHPEIMAQMRKMQREQTATTNGR
ncbi:amidohydrolase family protein [Trujillonella endophytica]|uniref:Predicted metal-dependent hydrolase, TIM-barrel fold n=1 Tax=Trujillonella endophytica TaxID=673521 RepID=A0A1H8WHK7_9ACTN|nr:amidohydrolase family protein [Trujillella endophytica]SEP27126.1 Predicted metal-dependent hydrolase, TIM-barrel fold [Trujillella endophytica]